MVRAVLSGMGDNLGWPSGIPVKGAGERWQEQKMEHPWGSSQEAKDLAGPHPKLSK